MELCFLCKVEVGMVEFRTTESLSTSVFAGPSMGTPIICNLYRSDLINSIPVFNATNSEPNVDVSTVRWDLEYQIMGDLFRYINNSV